MKKAETLEKVNTSKTTFKSNKTAKDFYGLFKDVKIPENKLEEELDKAKKLLRF